MAPLSTTETITVDGTRYTLDEATSLVTTRLLDGAELDYGATDYETDDGGDIAVIKYDSKSMCESERGDTTLIKPITPTGFAVAEEAEYRALPWGVIPGMLSGVTLRISPREDIVYFHGAELGHFDDCGVSLPNQGLIERLFCHRDGGQFDLFGDGSFGTVAMSETTAIDIADSLIVATHRVLSRWAARWDTELVGDGNVGFLVPLRPFEVKGMDTRVLRLLAARDLVNAQRQPEDHVADEWLVDVHVVRAAFDATQATTFGW